MTTINLHDYVDDETRPRRKRMKPSPTYDYSKFQPGNIVKLRLQNVMTYSITEFNLSPSLNMLVGPNGSGKSTFVCAVCLGLAGKPEYIGRSKKIDNFIKNGENTAQIDTFLRGHMPNEVIKITRIMTRNKKKSEYYIDDSPSTETAVRKLASELNIQLDNLCQFLSQEHVEDFAKLKSDKLLIETIRSINPSLLETLEDLKQLQTKEIVSSQDVELKNKKLKELEDKKDKLEVSVKSLEDFENKKIVLDKHNKLLPYVYIKEHKEKLKAYKNDYEIAKNNLKSLIKDKKPFHSSQVSVHETLEETKNKHTLKISERNELVQRLNQTTEKLNLVREDILKKNSQIDYYKNRNEKIKNSIKLTEQEIETNQNVLSQIQLPDPKDIEQISSQQNTLIEEEGRIHTSITDIDNTANTVNYEITHIARQAEQKQRLLTGNDRIGILDSRGDFKDVKNAILFIRTHEDEDLKSKILEPPIMSIATKDPGFAPYLAQCIDYNTSKALTIVDQQTFNNYGDQILKNFKVNLRELSSAQLKPPIPRDELQRRFGFEGYLSDFVSGDPNVIRMVCEFSNIHTIPVSRRELSAAQVAKLTQPTEDGKPLFRRVLYGNKMVNIRQSSYGSKQIFTVESNISPTKFYRSNIISQDVKDKVNAEIDSLKQKKSQCLRRLETLSSNKNDLKERRSDLRRELDTLRDKAYRLNEQRKKHSMTKSNIESLQQRLETYKDEARKDVSQKVKDVEGKISEQLISQAKLLTDMTNVMKSVNSVERDVMEMKIKVFEQQNLQTSLNEVVGIFNNREVELQEEYNTKKEIIKRMKNTNEFKDWMDQIRTYGEDDREALNELAESYERGDKFNSSYIKDYIEKLESELSMMNHDTSSVTILKQVESELNHLRETLPTQVKELKEIKLEMRKKHDLLEPQLNELVAKISKTFANLFTNVGSAGSVNLVKPHLYNDWKIEIMVKFRDNTQLKRLDSHTQSGGERAVSTVLYMIALQEFTAAPFRVVDEINQGMDQRNERIVHRAMVENACAENTSQYFLITPKLLTDLYYHEKMAVHCVFAGSAIPDPSQDSSIVHFGELTTYVA
ncbi:hypothetical protein KAFR_0D01330 [Kazachstania africana CBS 2517]|uniref:Structural maintenance of chromosomes protein 5 n=1 Tax=Kazachstania africana (strain ATCC 22294 / BCRC 22015 / CBS 2517 / CECT 1963 / NBRC 1671 / NRRL Y-8276) TaxID=1071382 RepID=H2ATS9_KAZAF|nr:hypothetical protein KAFR_0D01330 [Kazachstania africana CBS 2517]CCF57779.1 hypothetical protein KAFR_0D01330 [Kazachstania africana CBS 2517]